LQVGSAAGEIVRFLQHSGAEVRIAAIDSLVAIGAGEAASVILPLLQDTNRDVRIAAVRALGALSYTAARVPIEEALTSKRLRDSDRVEKVAFFEAYGRVSGADGVSTLDKILNTRNWIGRGETPEMRACAALGLARIKHASARLSLSAAASDSDPVVRTAVARALQDKG
jgi:HEAT repeat protein